MLRVMLGPVNMGDRVLDSQETYVAIVSQG